MPLPVNRCVSFQRGVCDGRLTHCVCAHRLCWTRFSEYGSALNVIAVSPQRAQRTQAAALEAQRRAHEAAEAAKLRLAAERLDEERRLRKIWGKDWQKHSKLQPIQKGRGGAAKNAMDARTRDDSNPTYDLECVELRGFAIVVLAAVYVA